MVDQDRTSEEHTYIMVQTKLIDIQGSGASRQTSLVFMMFLDHSDTHLLFTEQNNQLFNQRAGARDVFA